MPVPVVEDCAGAGVTAGAGNFVDIGDRDDFGGLSETPQARGGVAMIFLENAIVSECRVLIVFSN